MKMVKLSALVLFFSLSMVAVQAQTAEEIVTKHIEAIGGKQKLNAIKSIYMEGTLSVMGNDAPIVVSILNGKGYKSEVEFNGQKIVQAYTDKSGWMINPMMGASDPQPLPEEQLKMGRDQIHIGGALLDYAAKGVKVELLGKENVGTVNAFKLKTTDANKSETTYFIDPATYYILRAAQVVNMNGQQGAIDITFSNYKKTDAGYVMPYSMETTLPQGFTMNSTITKVELNKEIDPKIFEMPAK